MRPPATLFHGKELSEASKVIIMIHGRGASAESILTLSHHLHVNDFAILAPQAPGHSWYPYSFLAPESENEPYLTSAINQIDELVSYVLDAGFNKKQLHFLGFSQGACLTLEYITRKADTYGGIVAFTGGLIGETVNTSKYSGNFSGTPIFIGSSDPDMHVPVERVKETVEVLEKMDAHVKLKIYPGMPHTISKDEIDMANQYIFS